MRWVYGSLEITPPNLTWTDGEWSFVVDDIGFICTAVLAKPNENSAILLNDVALSHSIHPVSTADKSVMDSGNALVRPGDVISSSGYSDRCAYYVRLRKMLPII